MDKVSDFFSELKERISNPFIFSYLAAWCVWNYEIIIGLLFYKSNDLKIDGYKSYLDLINSHSSSWHFIGQPLLSAIGFTLLFPIVKNAILIYGGKINVWGEKRVLEDSKSGVVATDLYLEERRKYESAMLSISTYISAKTSLEAELAAHKLKETEMAEQISKIKVERDNAVAHEAHKHDLTGLKLQSFEYFNSKEFLQGTWDYAIETGELRDNIKVEVNSILKVDKNSVLIIHPETAIRRLVFIDSLSDTKHCVVNLGSHNNASFITWRLTIIDKDNFFGVNELNQQFTIQREQ